MAMCFNPRRMTPRGERWREGGRGAQEEKAWEERILTGHTEAAGSTSDEDLLGIHNPQGSLWCAI